MASATRAFFDENLVEVNVRIIYVYFKIQMKYLYNVMHAGLWMDRAVLVQCMVRDESVNIYKYR